MYLSDTNRPTDNVFKGDYYNLYNDLDIGQPLSYTATENDIIDTSEELMHHIMYYERPLELCLDGHGIRSSDLRRWGVTKERFDYLSTYMFTSLGSHNYSWTNMYNDKTGQYSMMSNPTGAFKAWKYAFKFRPGDPCYDSYIFLKDGKNDGKSKSDYTQAAAN